MPENRDELNDLRAGIDSLRQQLESLRAENATLLNGAADGISGRSWFRSHYLGTPIPTYLWRCADSDFILLDFNEAADKITRGKIAQFIGVRASNFYHDQPHILEDLNRCFVEKLVLQREMPYKFKSTGEIRTLSVVYAFLDPDLIVVHTEDITDYKRAEKSLRESEEQYRTLIEMSPQAIAIFQDHKVVFANPATAELLGYDRVEDVIGLDVLEPVPPEDAARREAYLASLLDGDTQIPRNFTFNGIRKDGTRFLAELFFTAITFGGRPAAQLVAIDITEKQKAESALRESEEKYRTLVEVFPQAIAIFQDEKAIFANQASATMFGYDGVDQYLGHSIFEHVPPDETQRLRDYHLRRMRGDKDVPTRYTARLMRRNGEIFPVEAFAARIVYRGRPAIQWVGIDITERKRIEEALRDSERRFHELFEHSALSYVLCEVITDQSGKPVDYVYLEVNKAFENITGLRSAEVVGKCVTDIFPVVRKTNLIEVAGGVALTGKPQKLEYLSHVVNRHLESIIYSPRPRQFASITTDITERKQAEDSLRESEERFRSIWEHSPVGICLTDRQGTYHYVNRAYCDIYGYRRQELIGKSFFDIIVNPGGMHLGRENYARYFDNPEPIPLAETEIFVRRGGEPVAVQYTSDFIEHGAVAQYMITMNIDITERKKAREALRESEEKYRLLFENANEAIANIDHDGRLLLINKSAAKYLGGVPEDFAGKSLRDIFPKQQAEQFISNINQVISQGTSFTTEGVVFLPGNPRWFRTNIQPIADSNLRIISALMIASDIHSEKQISIRNEARYNLLERLRQSKNIDTCLNWSCQAILEAQLFRRAVLTLHNEQREITNLGQHGLDDAIVRAARAAPAPDLETARKMTQEKYRIGHSYFIPEEEKIIQGEFARHIPQEVAATPGPKSWKSGDELFVPLMGDGGQIEGWLSVDTPFDGTRPSQDVINYLEEIIDITSKHVRGIQGMENLEKKNIALKEVLTHIEDDKMEFRQRIGASIDHILIPALNRLIRKDGSINKTYYNILKMTLPELAASSGAVISIYSKLSPREREICNLIINGLSSKEITDALNISHATVRKHREQIRRKLGISNKNINLVNFLKGDYKQTR